MKDDFAFLAHPDLRPLRLQLEFVRVEMALREAGIGATVVVFGGTQVVERARAEQRLAAAKDERARTVAARILAKSRFYDEAREFGRLVAEAGHTIVTGGGPGVMEAANRGAADAGAPSVGLNIRLPHEQEPNRFLTPDLTFQFRYFALRKMHFLLRARGLVCFPGGFGTLDEIFDALTLRQTGRLQPIPIVLVGRSYWRKVVDFSFLADEGVVTDEHVGLVQYAESGREAWEILRAS